MGKQGNVVLSAEVVKEIFRALFKERQEQALLTIVSDSTKFIHQRLDELAVDIFFFYLNDVHVTTNKHLQYLN